MKTLTYSLTTTPSESDINLYNFIKSLIDLNTTQKQMPKYRGDKESQLLYKINKIINDLPTMSSKIQECIKTYKEETNK